MILGMTVETFTKVHVVISLIAIASGLAVVFGMVADRHGTAGRPSSLGPPC